MRLVHETFLQCAILQVADKVAIAPLLGISGSTSPTSSSPSRIRSTIGWRWIVSRAWLQADRGIRIQVADYSLQRRWNSALLLIHSGRPLPASSSGSLCIQVLGLRIVSLPLPLRRHDIHLLSIGSLSWIRRWCLLLVVGVVHIVIHVGSLLGVGTLLPILLIELHACIRLALSLCLSLCLRCCLCPLFAQSLRSLLLLNTWSRRSVGTRSHRHGWYEWTSVLRLGDEWVHFGLIGCPSLQWVEIKQTLCKVDKRRPVYHFYES